MSLGCQLSAIPLKCNAAVPLETAATAFALNFFFISSSNKRTFGPCVIYFDFKDLETFHVWGVCSLNQNYEVQKYLKFNNMNIKNRKEFFSVYSKISKTIGINAMSISNITGIPRGTVFRKLQNLLKRKLLHVDNKKLYYPILKISKTDPFYKLSVLNIKRLSIFINKLLNLTNASK